MGDFNVDLLKYETDTQSSDFFDLLSSFNFRPLILQPTRVTAIHLLPLLITFLSTP